VAQLTDSTRAVGRLVRLLPYAVYTGATTATWVLGWGRVQSAWLIIAAVTYLALVIVQLSLDFFASAGPLVDVPSVHDYWKAVRWTIPITLLCAAPIPILGACLVRGGGTFASVCLVVASPVVARLMHDRHRPHAPPRGKA